MCVAGAPENPDPYTVNRSAPDESRITTDISESYDPPPSTNSYGLTRETAFASVDDLYLPATHVEHGPPSGPDEPALQVQLVSAPLPGPEYELEGHAEHMESDVAPVTDEYVPAPQLLHSASPVVPLYFPAKHGTQVPPLGPAYPALHVQSVGVELVTVDVECSGHNRHSDRSFAE